MFNSVSLFSGRPNTISAVRFLSTSRRNQGGLEMATVKIWVSATLVLASFFCVEARADDNLDCAGSSRRLGESSGPVLRAPHVTTRIDPHAAGVEACASVPKAVSVEWIRCSITPMSVIVPGTAIALHTPAKWESLALVRARLIGPSEEIWIRSTINFV
jgi:hypothetical protein